MFVNICKVFQFQIKIKYFDKCFEYQNKTKQVSTYCQFSHKFVLYINDIMALIARSYMKYIGI